MSSKPASEPAAKPTKVSRKRAAEPDKEGGNEGKKDKDKNGGKERDKSTAGTTALHLGFVRFHRAAVQLATLAAARARPLLLSELPPALLPLPATTMTAAAGAGSAQQGGHVLPPQPLPWLQHSLLAANAALLRSRPRLPLCAPTVAVPVSASPAAPAGSWVAAALLSLSLPPSRAHVHADAGGPLRVPVLWLPHRALRSSGGGGGGGGMAGLALAALPMLPLLRARAPGPGLLRCAERAACVRDCAAAAAAALAAELALAKSAAATATTTAGGAGADADAEEVDGAANVNPDASASLGELAAAGIPLGPLAAAAVPAAVISLCRDDDAAAPECGAADAATASESAAAVSAELREARRELEEAVAALRHAQAEAVAVAGQRARYDAHITRYASQVHRS